MITSLHYRLLFRNGSIFNPHENVRVEFHHPLGECDSEIVIVDYNIREKRGDGFKTLCLESKQIKVDESEESIIDWAFLESYKKSSTSLSFTDWKSTFHKIKI